MTKAFAVRTFLLCACVTVSLGVQAANNSAPSAPKGESSPSREEMNVLAKRAFEISLRTISKSGGVYPFALVSDGKDVSTMTADPKKEKRPQEKWFNQLSFQVRQRVQKKNNAKIAALVRMHSIKNEEGKKIRGVWALVDHRNHRPWVAFLPLVKKKDGQHKPGEIIYYATEEQLFTPQTESAKENSQ